MEREDHLKKSRISLALLCASLALIAGCPLVGPTLTFTEDESGTTASLAVGETLAVVLSGNASTGYEWEITELDTAVLANTGTSYRPHCYMPGCGETGTWTFTALTPGSMTLRMIYHRPWEDEEPSRTFELTVSVEGE
jgi:predicted secreted protein